MTDTTHPNVLDDARTNDSSVNPVEQETLLSALDNTTIHYYRYFPKKKMLVLPEATAKEWQCELVYHNVPEDEGFYAYLADEDKTDFLKMLSEINDGAPSAVSSFRLDDFERWCRVTMTTVARDEDGSPIEAIAIIEDRSEDMAREQVNQARNEALSFLTQVFQIAALATDATVVIFDYDTKTTMAPEATAHEWGVPSEHKNAMYEIAESGIVLPEFKEAYLAIHEEMLNGAEKAQTKIQLRDPSGNVGTYDLAFRALKNSDGTSARKAVGVYSNISLFERESLHQQAMSRALNQGINAAFFVDLDKRTFFLEKVMSAYMSRSVEEFVKVNALSGSFDETVRLYCEKFVCEEDKDQLLHELNIEEINRNFEETSSYYFQYRINKNDEGQEHFEMHVAKAVGLPGNNAFISFRCIDEQKERELQQQQALQDAYMAAQQASKAKSEFFSRMSHDIRTPMNAIIGMTALASTHIDDKKRVQDCLSKITLSSQHLIALINDVLDMSKIESGMVDLNVEDFDLSKLVENLISMSHQMINEYHHELLVNVHDIQHEKVVGDPQRIQQAFMNLMSNAIKYTPTGGTIRLSITEKPVSKGRTGCYEFVFEDNGIGMSEEFLGHIFEPFARAEDERVNERQGTGLGMSITHNIVQMMNGTISVESELGKGSKFTVTIYLELQEDNEDASLEHLEGLPILMVDDDQLTCESACELLQSLGMNAEWVLSGKEAVERVRKRHEQGESYFAVIVDWKMPEMDGLATTTAIRDEIGDEMPVVIVSAYDWSDIEAPARSAGVNGFISKPLFRSRVVRQFKELLNGAPDEVLAPTNAMDTLSEKDLSGKRVLLVEDNYFNREIASEFLSMTGLEIDYAENGREAVDAMEACEDGYYDLVFMDIQMPIMNGYDAARAIRSSERNYLKSVPIVAMTADAFVEDVHASRSAGMNEHIAKPIDLDKLNSVLDRWIGA